MNPQENPGDYFFNLSRRLLRRTINIPVTHQDANGLEPFLPENEQWTNFVNLFNEEAGQFGLNPFSEASLAQLFFRPASQFEPQQAPELTAENPLNFSLTRREFMQSAAVLGLTAAVPLPQTPITETHEVLATPSDEHAAVSEETDEHHEEENMSWLGYTVMTGMVANFGHIVTKAAKGGQFNGDTALRSLGLATICSKVLEKYGNIADKHFGEHIWAETYNPVTMGLAAALPFITNATELAKIAPAEMIQQEMIRQTDPNITEEEIASMNFIERTRRMVNKFMVTEDAESNAIVNEFGAESFDNLSLDTIKTYTQSKLETGIEEDKVELNNKLELLKNSMENKIARLVGRGNSLGFLVAPFMTTYMSTEVGNQLGELVFQDTSKLEFIKTLQSNLQKFSGKINDIELDLLETVAVNKADNLVNGVDGYVGNILSYFSNIAGVILAGDPPNFFAIAEAIKRGNFAKFFTDSTAWGTAESIAVGLFNSVKVTGKLLGEKFFSTENAENRIGTMIAFVSGIPHGIASENGFFRKLLSQTNSGELNRQFFERYKQETLINTIDGLTLENGQVAGLAIDEVAGLGALKEYLFNLNIHFNNAPANSLSIGELAAYISNAEDLDPQLQSTLSDALARIQSFLPQENFNINEVQALIDSASHNIQEVNIYTPGSILSASFFAFGNTLKGYGKNLLDTFTKGGNNLLHKTLDEFILLNFKPHGSHHTETFAERLRGERLPLNEVHELFSNMVYSQGSLQAFEFLRELGLEIPEVRDAENLSFIEDGSVRDIINNAVATFTKGLDSIMANPAADTLTEFSETQQTYTLLSNVFREMMAKNSASDNLKIDLGHSETYIRDLMGYTIADAEASHGYSPAAKEVQDALWTQIPHVAALVEAAKTILKGVEVTMRAAGFDQNTIDYRKLNIVTSLTAVVSSVADNVAAFLFSVGTMDSIIEEFKNRNQISEENIESAKHQSFLLSLRTAIYAGMLLKPGNGPNFKVVKNSPAYEFAIMDNTSNINIEDNPLFKQFAFTVEDTNSKDKLAQKIEALHAMGFIVDDKTIEQLKKKIEEEEQPAFWLMPKVQKLDNGKINVDPRGVEFAETFNMAREWGAVPGTMLLARAVNLEQTLNRAANREA